jgi:hypothetical protein
MILIFWKVMVLVHRLKLGFLVIFLERWVKAALEKIKIKRLTVVSGAQMS